MTDEQSTDAQLRDPREYVRNRGWELVTEFIDVGESGSKDCRPAWSDLWPQLRHRKFHVLLVAAIDRVGRSLPVLLYSQYCGPIPHLVSILSTISEQNVTLISLRECFDLSTPQGRMLAGLFSVLADYELSLIKETTRAGIRAVKARGSQIGPRKRCFDVKLAEQLRDQGMGIIKMSKELGGIGEPGRDHHMKGSSMWLAGGGVKSGASYGATDDLGYHATENVVHVRDLHATMLHLLGLDHRSLTYRHQGLDMKLTGVEESRVVNGILT